MLMTVAETAEKIEQGAVLSLAGDENLLKQLPKGQWIGGSIPYFMTQAGGQSSQSQIYVTELPKEIFDINIKTYSEMELPNIPIDAANNGFSLIIIPATSSTHITYAQNAPSYPEIFLKPIIGWIAGVHLTEIGQVAPKIFNGHTGEASEQKCVVMHVSLPDDKVAMINILNLFKQGDGDTLTFAEEGFVIKDCWVNGERRNLANYLVEKQVDTKYPLVADYCGAMVNVSFQKIDAESEMVYLYAPVFEGVEYKVAAPLGDYVQAFQKAFPKDVTEPVFACNCILNYLYSELEGKHTDPISGPITFGEVAYQLLNQTLVYLEIKSI